MTFRFKFTFTYIFRLLFTFYLSLETFNPVFSKRHEITVEDGCLLWGIRVIIPSQPRERVLYELHTGHPGIVRMKSLARLHVWWPNLDRDIATIVRKCDNCQKSRNKPQPWDWPKMSW